MKTEHSIEQSGISGSVLKLIAVITMLIDHIAAAILVRHFYATNDWSLYNVYYAMRMIGRIAFPIYCFMLVEGLERTRNRRKYLTRMVGFAVISEIPFDLAFSSQVLELGHQNVFFTLSIALAAMVVTEEIVHRIANPIWQSVGSVLTAVAAIALAFVMQTDYSGYGVVCILLMYYLRQNRLAELIAGYVAFLLLLGEVTAIVAFILLFFYRGKKGFSCKTFFYGFYPVHLVVLYGICVILGIHGISAV